MEGFTRACPDHFLTSPDVPSIPVVLFNIIHLVVVGELILDCENSYSKSVPSSCF